MVKERPSDPAAEAGEERMVLLCSLIFRMRDLYSIILIIIARHHLLLFHSLASVSPLHLHLLARRRIFNVSVFSIKRNPFHQRAILSTDNRQDTFGFSLHSFSTLHSPAPEEKRGMRWTALNLGRINRRLFGWHKKNKECPLWVIRT